MAFRGPKDYSGIVKELKYFHSNLVAFAGTSSRTAKSLPARLLDRSSRSRNIERLEAVAEYLSKWALSLKKNKKDKGARPSLAPKKSNWVRKCYYCNKLGHKAPKF